MFESTVELMDRLYVKLDKDKATDFQRDLACEARRRILQLDHLLTMVRHREEQLDSIYRRIKEATSRHLEDIRFSGLDFEAVAQPDDARLTTAEGECQ